MSLLCAVHYPARIDGKEQRYLSAGESFLQKTNILKFVKSEVKSIERGERLFPKRLMKVVPPVTKLWYRGEWRRELFNKTVAVVGSRRMSRYGKQVLSEVVPRLTAAGYTVVSGLMYGVDQEAHRQVLASGGKAVGVLGYGISYRGEEGAMRMARQIVESGGVVLSEYEGEMVSQRWMFPQRNRIVVGLSELVIVIEGGEKSGTMDSVRRAQKLARPIYAVPGSVFSPTSVGTNMLVASGAARALTMESLAELVGQSFGADAGTMDGKGLAGREAEMWTRLKLDGPSSANELSRKMGVWMGEILATLSAMEMKGLVKEERGVWRI